jgi:N-acetyl-D-muramate 6-phosphate phosphatase
LHSDIRNILFDLDGTLVDTAPDLADALNMVRREYGMPPLDLSKIRSVVSLGGTAMIKLAFNLSSTDTEFSATRQRFLDLYAENIFCKTKMFDGIEDVLDTLEENNFQWGIVTNKPGWLTTTLLEKMELNLRAGCVISGDSLPYSKPRPEPLLHACKLMECSPAEAVYIGDAKRDIEAGQNAGMATIIARYGYIEEGAAIHEWGATTMIDTPEEILAWLNISPT